MSDATEPNCWDCRFFNDSGNDAGECRRYPPVYLPNVAAASAFEFSQKNPSDLAIVTDLHAERAKYGSSFGYPMVMPECGDWCGEFQPKEQSDAHTKSD